MLTVALVKGALARSRPYKMGDAGGLYLFVAPTGLKSWRMKYRYAGREKLLTFGTFPTMTLAEARELRDDARGELRQGHDPGLIKQQAAAEAAMQAVTFEKMARSWHEHQRPRWSAVHAGDVLVSLERDVFPDMGATPLAAIDAPAVLALLRKVERRGCPETARRLRQRISAVFTLAMSEGLATNDPAAIVRKALAPSMGSRRHPALLELDDARALLLEAEHVDGTPIAKLASRFLALTAVRLACVRGAEWSEIEGVDWTGAAIGPALPLWRIPAERMKLTIMKKTDAVNAHLVPLSSGALDVLRAAHAAAGDSRYVFPGRTSACMLSESAIGRLYDQTRFAGQHVPHGWRATFSTVLNERLPASRALIDRALGHASRDKVEAAYNRAQHLAQRRNLLQWWCDLLST